MIVWENEFIRIEVEKSEIPWLKVFTQKKYKEFSECGSKEKVEIWRVLDIIEKEMLSFFKPQKITKTSLSGNKALGTSKRVLSWLDFPEGYILFDHDKDKPIWREERIDDLPETWKKRSDNSKLDNYYEFK